MKTAAQNVPLFCVMSRLLAEHEGYAVLNAFRALLGRDVARNERAVLLHDDVAYLHVLGYKVRAGADILLQPCYVLVGDIHTERYIAVGSSRFIGILCVLRAVLPVDKHLLEAVLARWEMTLCLQILIQLDIHIRFQAFLHCRPQENGGSYFHRYP